MAQYTNIPERDYSGGIDVRSAENQIAEGFVRDLLNADVVERRVRKRPGYQGFAGDIPVRVTKMDYDLTGTQVCFTLDSVVSISTAISLETVRSSPIVVYGRSSVFTAGQGPFTTTADAAKYYTSFSPSIRKILTAPSGTLSIDSSEHGFGTTNLFTEVTESTNLTDRSHSLVFVDSISIDETSYDLSIGYNTGSNKNVFVYYSDKTLSTGSTWIEGPVTVASGATTTHTITAGTHGLSNYNIVSQIQQDNGTSREQILPDQFLVATNGTVSVTITNNTAASADYYIILSAAPVSNIATGSVGSGATGTIVISDLEKPWIFPAVYLEQTPGGTKELILPDSISYDDSTAEATISFTNHDTTAKNFICYYELGDVRSNKLCVTDASVTTTGTDDSPQITIWGLLQSEIYTTKQDREGWVTHIDSYRRSGVKRMVCGLGGNLFDARTYSEVGTTYLLPQLYPSLTSRTDNTLKLGPAFWDTDETPARSRGYITSDNSGTHWATVTAVEYDSGTGWTKYTISVPNKQILDSTGNPTTLSSVISTTTDLEDWLEVQNMSYARHEGVFKIRQIQDGSDQIDIWVENDSNSSDYDDPAVGGQAGIFTDKFTWSSSSPYIPDDILSGEPLGTTNIYTVLSSSGLSCMSDGFTDLIEIPAGVEFTGNRTNSLIPTRSGNPNPVASVTNLVRGDMISYSGPDLLNGESSTERLFRVLYINPDSDRTVDVASDGTTATVTFSSGDTSYLTLGQKILLLRAGVYSGSQIITAIPSDTTLEFSSSETSSVSGATLQGKTVEIDEELEWSDTAGDTNYFTVDRRWIPLEAPDDSFDLTPATHTRYLDTEQYSTQSFLRSVMVVDNMYFTNYDDEVFKLDGSNIYRSGLIAWQPGLFVTQETTGSTIVTNLRSISYSATTAAQGTLKITLDDNNTIPVGTPVRLSGSTETYTVSGYTASSGTDYHLIVDRALDASVSATGTISEIGTFRYYFRLNAVDANSNIIASATTGFQDHVIELTANAGVQLKLVGLPAWDVYDYDRLECQIYRTKMNTAAPFYLITTLPMSFDNTTGYLQFTDSFADSDLVQLDIVNTALKGQELGTSWSDALRARYITTVQNKQVLANIQDWPQLDIQIVADASLANSTLAGTKLLFRRDDADAGTTTSMPDRAVYEFKNGTTGNTSNWVIGVDQFSFDVSSTVPSATGDWVYLAYSTVATTGRQLDYSGWWQVASVSGSTVTVNLTGAASATSYPDKYVVATATADIPVLLGTDGNLGMFNGSSFPIFDCMRRLSMAINSSMRQVDTSLAGMTDFKSWIIARGGNDTGTAGRILVRQPRSEQFTPSVVPTFSGFSLFVNSIKRTSGDSISATTRVFPSRIIVSYPNYPEIFDNPSSILDTESDSSIDINSADGQEITGVIPFFGEAAFTAAQQAAVLVVFKTNSIYLVDLNQKDLGQQAVQRIETEGLGCTAPYSIAATKSGIMFANESGMYCLRRDQSIQYLGRYMERNWLERVDRDALGIVQGHHWGPGRMYKITVPLLADISSTGYIEPAEAFVYNHTGEDVIDPQIGARGAWSRYDNHPAVGWANLDSDEFFASTGGRVFSTRQTGLISDFRDDNEVIDMILDTRPNDFGNSGIRKVIDAIIIHYRTGATSNNTSVSYALDLETEYESTTPVVISKTTRLTGISDPVTRDIIDVRHKITRRRGIYLSIRIENNGLDESIEIAGIDYKVSGVTEKGILQAAQTSNT